MDTTSFYRLAAARLGLAPIPLSLGFEITHLCNLACGYCDRNKRLENEMTREQIFGVLAEFIELGMRHVSLDGGEPLAHPDIDEIVGFLIEQRVRVYMNTNGSLVPRKLETMKKLARVKISLDGPRRSHDAMRGKGAFDKALRGAELTRAAGVEVELTCVVGTHNADCLDELVGLVEELGLSIVFQPARNSLFLDSARSGSGFMLDQQRLRAALTRIEELKRAGRAVGNHWSSLRHFRSFPNDRKPPCAAGWINATLDPEGYLFHCALVSRSEKRHNVLALGVKAAFESLTRQSCGQCWCARVVEENYAWGGRLDMLLPPSAAGANPGAARRLKVLG
jgi:MoaA/NifB/PqqE/SkfB family radical SAM enzyme